MRLWQVFFEVHRALPSLPIPEVVVEEQQERGYYIGPRPAGRGGQFVYTLAGEGRFKRGEQEWRLPPGTAFLHNHFDVETTYYYPEDGNSPWIFLWIGMKGTAAEMMIADVVGQYGHIYHVPRESSMIRRLYAWRSRAGVVEALPPLTGAGIVMDVLLGLGSYAEAELGRNHESRLVRRAQQLILESLDEPLHINELSDRLEVSREHLSRVFSRQAGVSPKQYIMEKRISQAKKLLYHTGMTCEEIAQRVGYEHSAAFSRAFRRATGLPPRAFREL